jgi:Flp pilus assembly protein TadD
VCGVSVDAHSGILVLRFLTLIFGLLQLIVILLSLRLIFPGRLAAQLVGLVLAAFLPMQIYLSHYVTNETLAATLITASVYLGLRLLWTENPSVSQFAWLGLCMGAAMLTKATALLLVPPLCLALTIKLARERAPVAIWLRHFGAASALFLATCGWHYLRIWREFGNPLLGNWDVASGFAWWQDPGFHTGADYVRFGKSFVAPLFSAFWSFADGVYSTLWGDGLCAGVPSLIFRPPWNYDLMVAGYFLALFPTLLILAGAAAVFWRFVRKPSVDWFVLIGLTGGVALGLVFMTLKVASYAQVKAFYGLAMLVPLCFFAAVGWEVLTRGHRVLQGTLGALLLVWAMNSFASFWIVHSAPQHLYVGLRLGAEHKFDAAGEEAAKAVNSDPSNPTAQRFLASVLSDSGRADEALSHAQQAVALSPMDDACHLQLGTVLVRQGQMEPAIGEARRALELGPENPAAYNLLLVCLSKLGRGDEAINVTRDGLAQYPFNAELHDTLGVSLAQKEDFIAAARHFAYALLFRANFAEARSNFRLVLRFIGKAPDGLKALQEVESLAPDAPVILGEIAWFLATQPDATLRNGNEAVRLAEHASALTNHPDPRILATLAAAYAEAARIPEAVKIAEEARLRARSDGDAETVGLSEKLLASFQRGHAYQEEPARK